MRLKFTGTISDVSIDFKTNKPKITFIMNERTALAELDAIKDLKKLSIEAKKYRKKRSSDANAYMWTIAEKIAEKINITKIDVYREAIRNVGQCEVLPIKDEAVQTFVNAWEHNGQGWICEIIGKSKMQGYTNITAYYGSSVYDNKSMSRLVDLIVQEAKELNIETLPPAKLEALKEAWK